MENYRGDYYDWLNTTALAIEEGRLCEIDAAQVAEELRDMGKSERRALRSHLKRVLVRLLKIAHQPGKHTRSWDLSIEESRLLIREELEESPSLRRELSELLVQAYRESRLQAARQTGLDLSVVPDQCPYTVDETLGKDK
jgi:CRP-like cAMP-binding protein